MTRNMAERVLGGLLLLALCSCGRQAADDSYDQTRAKAEIEKSRHAMSGTTLRAHSQ